MSYVPSHAPQKMRAVKTAFRRLVETVGGLAAAATVTRVSISALAEYYHPNKPECWPPADVVADLEAVAQEPIVTALMAGLAHCTLAPLPEAVSGDEAVACAESFQAAAEGMVALMVSMADGRLDDAERAILVDKLGTMCREGQRAMALLSGPALVLRGGREAA